MGARKNNPNKYGVSRDTRRHPSEKEISQRLAELKASVAQEVDGVSHLWEEARDVLDRRILDILHARHRVQRDDTTDVTLFRYNRGWDLEQEKQAQERARAAREAERSIETHYAVLGDSL